jgi:flagellar basal-body rod protein FlgC
VSFESELINNPNAAPGSPQLTTVRVAGISNDPTPGQRVNDPGHPDADADGMVTPPNVNIAYEMVDLITASRTYEANLSVAKNAHQMALKALDIGK